MSEAGMISIAISALAVALLIWSTIRSRQYAKWNEAANSKGHNHD